MKQVYFSEKLNKYFDSKKECEAAEAAFDQEKIKKEKAKEEADKYFDWSN